MKRSIARKWAKALESGEYKQITGQLRKGDAMCCLGVLCNLHAQENPEVAAEQKHKECYLGQENELPFEVMEYSGMVNDEGRFQNGFRLSEYPDATCLVDLNDDEELTFPEIAKIIRKHWKEL